MSARCVAGTLADAEIRYAMREIASPGQLRKQTLLLSLLTVPALEGAGFLSGMAARSGPGNPWFDALAMPAIYPPPLAFPVAWSVLYLLMGVALAMVLAARGAAWRAPAITVFVVQLALNLAWSPVFFGLHRISVALLVIGALALALAATIWLFARVRPVAAWLLLPYLGWVVFASVLNWQILVLNPDADGRMSDVSSVTLQG